MENNREVLGKSDDGSVWYTLLTEDLLADSVKVLNEGYHPFDSVSIASNVPRNPKAVTELNLLATEYIKENVSIAAIDNQTNKVIGVSVNKILEQNPNEENFYEKFIREKCKEKESKALLNTFSYCDSSIDLFHHLKIDKILELMCIAVIPGYRKRGIGTDLIKYDIELLQKLSVDENGPKAISALFTSYYSQRIAEKLGFEVLLTIDYNTFSYDGVKFSTKIGAPHKGIKLAVKKCIGKEPDEVCERAGART